MPRSVTLRSSGLLSLALLLLLGADPLPCTGGDARPRAVVLPDRSGHLLDRPYPSDELRTAEGWIALEGFPVAGPEIGRSFLRGWLRQVSSSVSGFSAMTPIFFRLDGPPALLERYDSLPADPVRLFSLDSEHRVPVRVRYVSDAGGDPYLRDGLLVVVPDERHPLRSGERYAAVVARRVVRPAEGWTPPEGLGPGAAEAAGVATVFTVQDPVRVLRTLREVTDAALAESPALLRPAGGLREVAALRYEQGRTPSGRPSTLEIVRFADGGSEITFLDDRPGAGPVDVDLGADPMQVLQATIHTLAFQDPAGRPWQSPGIGIITDTGRSDGWMPFDAEGRLSVAPTPEAMRVVVQVPRKGTDHALVLWGHGSGGDAYEAVQRTDPANDGLAIRTRLAARGAIVVSADQPLFGRRFAGTDLGYDDNLTVVNIPNLPAFRDNVRQGAVDRHVLLRFAREALPALLRETLRPNLADTRRIGAFGHSIGAQIGAVAAALDGRDLGGLLLNGTGGFQTHSVLASDLIQIEGTVAELIFAIAGLPVPADPTPAAVLGALFGVPESAVPGIDRHHPLAQPFQLVVDGGDPLPVAAEHPVPVTVFYGEGDSFVPPEGAAWLADASRDGELVPCTPGGVYDGHYCIFREEAGLRALERLVDGL